MKLAEHWVDELDANETGVAICTAAEIKAIQENVIKACANACHEHEPHGGVSDWSYAHGPTQSLIRSEILKLLDKL